jgi:hypothetical protein
MPPRLLWMLGSVWRGDDHRNRTSQKLNSSRCGDGLLSVARFQPRFGLPFKNKKSLRLPPQGLGKIGVKEIASYLHHPHLRIIKAHTPAHRIDQTGVLQMIIQPHRRVGVNAGGAAGIPFDDFAVDAHVGRAIGPMAFAERKRNDAVR